MFNILICDDDGDIVNALKIYLSSENYNILTAHNGEEAILSFQNNLVHLILIDIMMPKVDGISAMVKIRETSNVPIIMLTAKSEDTDKVLGLNLGADDYITKPFNPIEVIARVKSQIRRFTNFNEHSKKNDDLIVIDNIELCDMSKTVKISGENISVTPTEYNILLLLMKNVNRVFSPKEIYERVWNSALYGNDNIVAVHIRHLREKIEINPNEPQLLKVVWGQGYKVEMRYKNEQPK